MRNRTETLNDEVLFTREPVTLVDAAEIDSLKAIAARTPRRRVRLCTHHHADDPLHEMLILHARDAYVRPHLHTVKPESFLVIEGTARLFLFDESGRVTHAEDVGPPESGRGFYARFPAGQYHCFVITADWLVFHETTLGPFDRGQLRFAPWAPAETETDAVRAYVESLMTLPTTLPGATGAAAAMRETADAL